MPTGSVTFYAGSTPLGTASLSGGQASLKTTSLLLGSQAIAAVYSGNASYAPSTSAVLTQMVKQDTTTTKVNSSVNPSVCGGPVTLTAIVNAASPGSGTPTGTVTFYDGTTDLGVGALSGGTATLSTSFTVFGGTLDQSDLRRQLRLLDQRLVGAYPERQSTCYRPNTNSDDDHRRATDPSRKLKKGKPTGKAVLSGFALDFGVPLNAAAASDAANYQLDTITTKKVKKKKETILHPITNFTVSYLAASDVVKIALGANETFPTGGQITVLGGLTTPSGGTLSGPAVFTISAGGRIISAQ